jgi:hypothetical protein
MLLMTQARSVSQSFDFPLPPAGAPAIPPAEDWVRTALVQGDFIAEQPVSKDIVLTAGASSMRSPRDARGMLTDFRALAHGSPDSPQAFADALRGAQQMSHALNLGNLWLRDPLVAVLRGRDGFLWGVLVREGDGTQPMPSDESRVPTFEHASIAQFRPTAWQEDVVATVSGGSFIDLRLDVNGAPVGTGELEPVPVAPAPPADQLEGATTSKVIGAM